MLADTSEPELDQSWTTELFNGSAKRLPPTASATAAATEATATAAAAVVTAAATELTVAHAEAATAMLLLPLPLALPLLPLPLLVHQQNKHSDAVRSTEIESGIRNEGRGVADMQEEGERVVGDPV